MKPRILGSGAPVVMIPSLGRPGSDFDVLGASVADAGFTAVVLDPPGVNGVPPLPGQPTLHDLADAVAAAVRQFDAGVHVIGHAFGGRVARCLAVDRPGMVSSLIVLGAGGQFPGDAAAREALMACFDPDLAPAQHLDAVRTAFFAPGNDPAAWTDGWWPDAARAQRRASAATPPEQWWLPPAGLPMLVLVGAQDRISPPANGRQLAAQVGQQVSLVEIEGAGHALLPERPAEVAGHVIEFLRGRS